MLGPSEQRTDKDSRKENPAEGAQPINAGLRPGNLGHEATQPSCPGEPADRSDQEESGKPSAGALGNFVGGAEVFDVPGCHGFPPIAGMVEQC